ncbi:hypothetical protein PZN02_005404 [Sinorhizobium garamanticum]|uniref:Uncharacterized protein n=1 Tax=Sinorhizobium garamanticum TaxID=680247 RepID=A0ABY8DJA1_9HYPH|nr:hypothetical protein [Sinorhizobium garamanticum]WEX90057.1 hypothetical protein PZN02_005404 [Sinorhizobium garamanticum]
MTDFAGDEIHRCLKGARQHVTAGPRSPVLEVRCLVVMQAILLRGYLVEIEMWAVRAKG